MRDRVARLIWITALLIRVMFALEVVPNDLDLSKNDQLDVIWLQENAARIAAGDLLLREPYMGHYADVRDKIYGPARYDRLFGPHPYLDSPGYLYFAGATQALLGRTPYATICAQLLLDAVTCWLVYLIGRRMGGLAVGRVALAASALDLEQVGHAGFVLRESFIAFLATLVVLALDGARRSGTTRSWFLAGLAFGAGWVTKLTFQLLLPIVPVLVLLAPRAVSADGTLEPWKRAAARRLAVFVVGFVLPVLPFASRNVALGEPPLQLSTLARNAIVQWNLPSYSGAAEHMAHAEVHAILERSDDTLLGTWFAVMRAHPDKASYAALIGRKLRFFWMATDFWNNISVWYLQPLSPALQLCVVRWGVLAPWVLLALVGAVFVPRRRTELLPLVATFLALGLSTALVGGVYSRFRMVVAPVSCVLFAIAIVDVATLLWQRDRRSRALGAALLAAGVLLHVAFRDPQPPLTRRALAGYVLGTWPSRTARAYLLKRVERSSAP